MTPADVLKESFGRSVETAHVAVDGLDEVQLAERLAPHANSIAWLVWHTAREQDVQMADLTGTEQVWTAQGYDERFGLPFAPDDFGYGHGPEQVAQVRASGELLVEYLTATNAASLAYLDTLIGDDLDEIIDERWDPPVSRGVRLVSIVDDAAQHLGTAAFLRGLIGG